MSYVIYILPSSVQQALRFFLSQILDIIQHLFIYLFIWVLTLLSTHCIHHMTGSFMGRGNQYIHLVKVLHCKLLTNDKQLSAFPLEVGPETKPGSQRWEVRVLLLCHHGPFIQHLKKYVEYLVLIFYVYFVPFLKGMKKMICHM